MIEQIRASIAVNILSLQSHVAYGHVGNSAAVFTLQRLGIEVWPIHTVQFSNHTGYGAWRGRAFDASLIQELIQGIDERGVLGACDGVLSGYLGSAGIGVAILDAVARVKSANPRARYCCDPVIGDVGRGVFVQPGIAEFMRLHAVPAADVVTPNHFELDHLTGRNTRDWSQVAAAVDALRALGPRTVLVTSLVTNETPADAIDLVACDDGGRYRVRTPKLPISVNGAGDAIAALFFAHHRRSDSAAEALSRAASSIFGILRRTAEAGSREILLIDAQDELVNPSVSFRAEPLQDLAFVMPGLVPGHPRLGLSRTLKTWMAGTTVQPGDMTWIGLCKNDRVGIAWAPMEFGIFDHLDRSPSSLADYYEERLAIVELFARDVMPALRNGR